MINNNQPLQLPCSFPFSLNCPFSFSCLPLLPSHSYIHPAHIIQQHYLKIAFHFIVAFVSFFFFFLSFPFLPSSLIPFLSSPPPPALPPPSLPIHSNPRLYPSSLFQLLVSQTKLGSFILRKTIVFDRDLHLQSSLPSSSSHYPVTPPLLSMSLSLSPSLSLSLSLFFFTSFFSCLLTHCC